MANRCLNKIMLIGNLTRDPELRFTPQGVAVCSFGLATNRRWTTQAGDQKEDAQFHRIVAWNKLAELCSQLLAKGRRVYVEGRLQYREWTGSDGNKRRDAEIVISDMIILDSQRAPQEAELESELEQAAGGETATETAVEAPATETEASPEEPASEPTAPAAEEKTAEEKTAETGAEEAKTEVDSAAEEQAAEAAEEKPAEGEEKRPF